jgi:hypothetical protein
VGLSGTILASNVLISSQKDPTCGTTDYIGKMLPTDRTNGPLRYTSGPIRMVPQRKPMVPKRSNKDGPTMETDGYKAVPLGTL